MTEPAAPYSINGHAVTTNSAAQPTVVIPPEVLRKLAELFAIERNVRVELDFKDGVVTNARYQLLWRRSNTPVDVVNRHL